MTDPTHSLVEHIHEVYERCMAVVDVGLEITHIEAVNDFIHLLSPQWGNMGIMVRDEMLEGNPPEHQNTIDFNIYCQTLLDR